jgi:hypothetical protein
MASNASNGNGSQLLVVGDTGGITVIDPSTPLKRLNYFDGKFLRAADFDVEQGYLRQLVALSNQGLGPGVVYGYNTTQGSGDTVQIGPGLAIDPYGKVLLLQSSFASGIQALIDTSKKTSAPASAPGASGTPAAGGFSDCVQVAAPPPTAVVPVSDIYVIVICSAEALCGQQDVYGVQCQDACVTSSDRPYRLDGVVVRALPLQLVTPFPTSQVAIDSNLYLRSKVAHSWFADEVLKHPNAISRDGLLSETWCLGAAYDAGCCEVPLAVVARAGATTVFLDAWTVRRERIDAPAKRYWQWKMRMRPWDVFLAQILQFQCQLADLLSNVVTPGNRGGDPCAPAHQALGEAAQLLDKVRSGLASYRSVPANATLSDRPALLSLSLTEISDLHGKLQSVLQAAATPAQPKDRILIRGGILELPSAGYLPVVNGTDVSVNDQVRALLGEGLDLRFCITTADYIAHAVEEAQHMDRISLLQGIDDPKNKPHVDILVPDGTAASSSITPTAGLYNANLTFSLNQKGLVHKGAAREVTLDSGGTALYLAAAGLSQAAVTHFQTLAQSAANAKPVVVTADVEKNTFIQKTAAAEAKVDTLVANAALQARGFINAAAAGLAEPVTKATATPRETVDGLWLTGRADQQVKSLGVHGHTAVSLRIVLGTQPASPHAIELTFNGTLSISGISSAAAGLIVTGTVNGLLSVGQIRENQSQQKMIEYLLTERLNWPVTLTYAGDDANGSITVDLTLKGNSLSGLRLTKTFAGSLSEITYRLDGISKPPGGIGPPAVVLLGELGLIADPAVINPGNPYHQAAVSGLDLDQAALIVSEPAFETNAEGLLFPALPAATKELVIRAVRDWVAFTRRREKKCERDVEPVPPVPPRSYRVLNVTVEREVAKDRVDSFTKLLKDPTKLATTINSLLEADSQGVKLVVTFAGGTAVLQSKPANVKFDWETFNPGNTIYYAAVGAVGESDAALQLSRLKTFEGAISADSKENLAAQEVTLVPYPPGAAIPGADGVMFFITVPAATEKQHVYAANANFYIAIQDAAKNGILTTELLTRGKDLGLASYTASAAGAVTVTDDDVKSTFQSQLSGNTIQKSLVLSRKGDSNVDYDNRALAAEKIVTDLVSGSGLPTRMTYTGTWPLTDAPSMLVVQVLQESLPPGK